MKYITAAVCIITLLGVGYYTYIDTDGMQSVAENPESVQ